MATKRTKKAPAKPKAAAPPMLQWEAILDGRFPKQTTAWLFRAKVPGGWLMAGGGMTFVPDPKHAWDGSSLP